MSPSVFVAAFMQRSHLGLQTQSTDILCGPTVTKDQYFVATGKQTNEREKCGGAGDKSFHAYCEIVACFRNLTKPIFRNICFSQKVSSTLFIVPIVILDISCIF